MSSKRSFCQKAFAMKFDSKCPFMKLKRKWKCVWMDQNVQIKIKASTFYFLKHQFTTNFYELINWLVIQKTKSLV